MTQDAWKLVVLPVIGLTSSLQLCIYLNRWQPGTICMHHFVCISRPMLCISRNELERSREVTIHLGGEVLT